MAFERPVCSISPIYPIYQNFLITLFTVNVVKSLFRPHFCKIFEQWSRDFHNFWNIVQQWKQVVLSCNLPFLLILGYQLSNSFFTGLPKLSCTNDGKFKYCVNFESPFIEVFFYACNGCNLFKNFEILEEERDTGSEKPLNWIFWYLNMLRILPENIF